MVNPLLTNTPCEDQLPDPIEQEIPNLYPSCAVTRAMVKKAKLNDGIQYIDLTDTFIGQSFHCVNVYVFYLFIKYSIVFFSVYYT